PPTPAPSPVPPTPVPAPAPVAAVARDFEFAPKQLTVKAGTVVTWTNGGAQPHSVTAVDKSFDTGLFGPGESRSVTFDRPGTYAYYCIPHGVPDGSAGMVGTVVVEP
ncbi:MAG TPA: plastocyanin/azurin family copper-binding protein, partial [Roseiflexaceae bacterium]|nr:plastocyanin/azurin family copper-binding protein [Roseiflexaceae bacterium]